MMPLNIIVVGAGLGGLAAAIALKLKNHTVVVLEASKKLTEFGAGVTLSPNATRCLHQWRMAEQLASIGTESRHVIQADGRTGEELMKTPGRKEGEKGSFGFP
jgi:2-polyprenyl-6-methoxyphenol hydroxylase-like FAD-dependent oxidoreductase